MASEENVNFLHLLNDLENQELEAPSGVASAQIYGQMLALYLLFNDTCNAKLVWKRTPAQIKTETRHRHIGTFPETGQQIPQPLMDHWLELKIATEKSNPELALIWAIGQKMLQRDYPGVYETLKKEWPDYMKPFMAAMLESTRKRAFDLIGLAYSSINSDVLATFVGLPVSEATQTAVSMGWKADTKTHIVTPRKPDPPPCPPMLSEQQLSVLTDYVSFLEN